MSVKTRVRRTPPQNLLLAALPAAVYRRISPSLESVPMRVRDVFQKPGDRIEDVYFPEGGFCSILTVLDDGSMVEVATVGREGMLGVAAILDQPHASPAMTMVQAASDRCWRMPIGAFRRELLRRGAFSELLSRYAVAHIGFVMQSTACNAKHSVERRLARWLLLAHDRVGQDEFPITQEFAAMMLGASRPTVTAAASALQKAGLIEYHRGMLRIVRRKDLERASCECYQATTKLFNEFKVQ